ncbi:MAG: hypothetical protein ITG02_10315 [Patulibacter sp.]|nr:hypothetical protein [Patulibacter sp.]
MARLQELHPDQQAVLRLILGRRMSYGELASVLDLPADRVRERALDAIDGLAPDDVEGLELDDRDRIADYLLGQQDDQEQAATERLIAQSAPAREWLGQLTPELSGLTASALPLPDPQPAARGASTSDEPPPAPSAGITAAFAALDAPQPRSSRVPAALRSRLASRNGRIAAGLVGVIVLVLVVLLATGTFGGGDDRDTTADTPTTTATEPSEAALAAAVASALPQQINLTPPGSATGAARDAAAVGMTNINDNIPGIVFQAEKLPKLESNRVYSIWVTGGGQPAALLGRLDKIAETDESLIDDQGTVAPVFVPFATRDSTTDQDRVIDVRPYERIRVTRESPNATKPGPTVLSGPLTSSTGD